MENEIDLEKIVYAHVNNIGGRNLLLCELRRAAALTERIANLEGALDSVLKAEWMVSCDWTDSETRNAVLSAARAILKGE